MSHRMGYRFLSPPHSEITRKLAESAEGAFFEDARTNSLWKSGIKHAKNAFSSACSIFWNYIFPPAQIGVISRDAYSSLKKIHPISEFIEDSIPQPKPLHKDTGTIAPTPGRFDIKDSELKRTFEETTPYQAKRLKNEENSMLSVINSEKSTAAERESFKPIIPDNKIKIPPWRKMQIKITETKINNKNETNDNSRVRKEEENLMKIVKNDKDEEKGIMGPPMLYSAHHFLISRKSEESKLKPTEIKQSNENDKQEQAEIKPPIEEVNHKPVETILTKDEAKQAPLENIQEEKEKSSEESTQQSESENTESESSQSSQSSQSSPAMSFGNQSQDLSSVSPTPKKLNDTNANSFYVRNIKELEKINENEEKEKNEVESVKTERSTPQFDKDGKSKESDKKIAENSERFIKADTCLNPFESKIEEIDKNVLVKNLFKASEETNTVEKSISIVEENKGQLPKPIFPFIAPSNPFFNSFSSESDTNDKKDHIKPLFVFGAQNSSSSAIQLNQPPTVIPNPFGAAINLFPGHSANSSTSAPTQYNQPMPTSNASSINPFRSFKNPLSLSSSNPFQNNYQQNPSLSNPPFQSTATKIPTISPITYEPPYGSFKSQNFQTESNIQAQPNFPYPSVGVNMDGSAKLVIDNKNSIASNQPFPQNTAQGTFNMGALPNRKFLKARRPDRN